MPIGKYLSLVKISHTVFALPFALLGFFLAVQQSGVLPWNKLLLVILCMIFARTAAMAFNRYADRKLDAKNPRTEGRELPTGDLKASSVMAFVIFNSLAFIVTAYFINSLCFYLSPVALLVVLGYSYTKRFTILSHFVLGLGLALAPVGAYLAVTGAFDWLPLLYGTIVFFWVSGFDIIYALQDEHVDQELSLRSIPARFGGSNALIISNSVHMICGVLTLLSAWLLGEIYDSVFWIHWIGASVFILLLLYQHRLVKPNDLSKVNLAFFTLNGYASIIFCSLVIFDFYI